MQDDFLSKKLQERKEQHSFRSLKLPKNNLVDLCSNDYLGIATNQLINSDQSSSNKILKTGSTGSRLLSGNYEKIEEAEKIIADFHQAEAALIFNSGYDANLGLLRSVPQRSDIILYDSLSHASIRDGIRLSFASAFSFQHNDVDDLEKKLIVNSRGTDRNIFIVTESVFSMDGDIAPLKQMVELCDRFNAKLIVDEAHATGVVGERGEGLVQHLKLQEKCFAFVPCVYHALKFCHHK